MFSDNPSFNLKMWGFRQPQCILPLSSAPQWLHVPWHVNTYCLCLMWVPRKPSQLAERHIVTQWPRHIHRGGNHLQPLVWWDGFNAEFLVQRWYVSVMSWLNKIPFVDVCLCLFFQKWIACFLFLFFFVYRRSNIQEQIPKRGYLQSKYGCQKNRCVWNGNHGISRPKQKLHCQVRLLLCRLCSAHVLQSHLCHYLLLSNWPVYQVKSILFV